MTLSGMITITAALISTLFFLAHNYPRLYTQAYLLLFALMVLAMSWSVGFDMGRDSGWNALISGVSGPNRDTIVDNFFANAHPYRDGAVGCLIVATVANEFARRVAKEAQARQDREAARESTRGHQ